MTNRVLKFAAVLFVLVAASTADAATTWSAQDYDLYPGDFNGDGKNDVLYIAKASDKFSGIAVSDDSGPNIPWQSWPSNYLGIQWYGGLYAAIIGDFNNDNRSDVLLQRATPGDSYLLLAGADGRLTGISQTIGSSHLGVPWSKDQHTILPGDLSGDSRDDLFFQAAEPSGFNAVALADTFGLFTGNLAQTFTDASWSVFKWSRKNSVISVGDFNGDGRSDLLIQTKPNIVMIDYDIPIPVPVYPPNSFGIVYSQGGATPLQQIGVQQWSRISNGVDWSPTNATPVIGDFSGDGRDDVLLQAHSTGQPSYLLLGNASGAAFSAPTAVTSNVSISSDGARLIAIRLGNGAAGLYVQSTTASGTNYVATAVGATLNATTHDPVTVTTETVSYSYDAKGRLTRVTRSGNVNNNVQTDYTYDKANNRKTVVTTGSENAPQ